MQRNLKVSAILNIAAGLFFLSIFFDHLAKGKLNYFGLAIALLILFNGTYSYFFRYKDLRIIPSRPYGIFCIAIGLLVLIATTFNLYNLKLNLLSLILGYSAALINLATGIILILKKD